MIIIVLSTISLIFIYTTINLYRKQEIYNKLLSESFDMQQKDYEFINSMNDEMISLNDYLNSSSLRVAFENDDEVGVYFDNMKIAHSKLVDYLKKYNTIYIGDNDEYKTEKE